MTSKGRPNLTFKGRPWEVDGRDVPRTLSWHLLKGLKARLREDVRSSVGGPNIYFCFSFRAYSFDQIDLKGIQHSTCVESPVELHFLQN